jgi:hypothetical protein
MPASRPTLTSAVTGAVKDFVGVGFASGFSVAQATAPVSTAAFWARLSAEAGCSGRKKYLAVLFMAAPITANQRKTLSAMSLAVFGFDLLDSAESVGIRPSNYLWGLFRRPPSVLHSRVANHRPLMKCVTALAGSQKIGPSNV